MYVFTRNKDTGVWSELLRLYSNNPGAFNHFGTAVALSATFLCVGAPVQTNDQGVSQGVSSVMAVAVWGCVCVCMGFLTRVAVHPAGNGTY